MTEGRLRSLARNNEALREWAGELLLKMFPSQQTLRLVIREVQYLRSKAAGKLLKAFPSKSNLVFLANLCANMAPEISTLILSNDPDDSELKKVIDWSPKHRKQAWRLLRNRVPAYMRYLVQRIPELKEVAAKQLLDAKASIDDILLILEHVPKLQWRVWKLLKNHPLCDSKTLLRAGRTSNAIQDEACNLIFQKPWFIEDMLWIVKNVPELQEKAAQRLLENENIRDWNYGAQDALCELAKSIPALKDRVFERFFTHLYGSSNIKRVIEKLPDFADALESRICNKEPMRADSIEAMDALGEEQRIRTAEHLFSNDMISVWNLIKIAELLPTKKLEIGRKILDSNELPSSSALEYVFEHIPELAKEAKERMGTTTQELMQKMKLASSEA